MEVHEYAKLFPPMSNEEFEELVEDIKQNGQLEPIILHEGKILDGRNRYNACLKLGIKPKMKDYDGENLDPLSFVISKNIKRRHLTASQKALLALEIKPLLEKEARKRQATKSRGLQRDEVLSAKMHEAVNINETNKQKNIQIKKGRSDEQAGKIIGVSGRYISQAEKVKKEAPELVEKIMAGEMNLSEASKEIKKKQREEKIRQTIEQAKIDNKEKDNVKIIHGDMTNPEIQKLIETESIDAIITDPPYPQEYLPLWDELAKFAKKVLKPSGLLVTYCGQIHLDTIVEKLSKELQYYWILTMLQPGATTKVFARNVLVGWKPILIFQKPPFMRINSFYDVFKSEQREKDLHEWQQSESGVLELIEKFTLEGQIILDPFAGSGTTLAMAIANGRKAIGIEKDEKYVKIIKERLGIKE
ncbi:MAG TPA: DNA methyltransferase [Candidatus Pacearchaeota archaeon]|nr:DNA methyltransferase [Candidatus Pacearchaeota archaeon]